MNGNKWLLKSKRDTPSLKNTWRKCTSPSQPLLAQVLTIRREIFEESDTDKDNTLSLNEVAAAFQKLQSKITSYPAVSATPRIAPLPCTVFNRTSRKADR
jgi:hypothetical protein